MNSAALWGWVGGIGGALIGLAGGIAGTYFSIKNTKGPRERAFMISSAVVSWIAILVFLALLLSLSHSYRWLLWIPYGILLTLGIVYVNRRQLAIRQDESKPNSNIGGL